MVSSFAQLTKLKNSTWPKPRAHNISRRLMVRSFLASAVMALSLIYALQLVRDVTHEGVMRCSDVENYMSAVERVHACSEIESERGYEYQSLPTKPWPTAGCISFNSVSLKYFRGGPRMLKDVSFAVRAREKLAITEASVGSGRSAVVHALFLMPAYEGQVLLDDVKTRHLNLQTARRSISVVTRDAILFLGTVRNNVDPFDKHTDKDIWGALERVQLKTWVQGLPKQLYQDLAAEGECSAGPNECQLLSLARALLQENKVLVIDEASACVDYKTDRIIQETIRSHFQATTVITVPHRLSTIIDYHRVLVLDRGRIVELDKPEVLLKKEEGYFAHMYEGQAPG